MGTIQHDVVICTVWEDESIAALRAFVASVDEAQRRLFCEYVGMNLEVTFCMLPDGSKEGWDVSDAADKVRVDFKRVISACGYPKGFHARYGELGFSTLTVWGDD